MRKGLLGRPSRSYKDVDHNAEGLSAVGSAPYGGAPSKYDMPDNGSIHTVKTYRPSYAELHFKRQAMHDPHPSSSFSPLPPAFNLGRKVQKEQALAGQRAELNHILEPGYKSGAHSVYGEDEAASVAGPSRLSSVRTAGGLGALARKHKDKVKDTGDGLRAFHSASNLNKTEQAGGGKKKGLGGVYVDSSGRLHDTEYDPFAGVAEMSRRKSRRRSAFGHQRRHSSGSSCSEASSDSGGGGVADHRRSYDDRTTNDEPVDRERDEIRRRLEVERRRLDEVSGYAAARRRSMMSDRASGFMSGRATPSIRSGEDGLSTHHSLAPNGRAHSRMGQASPVAEKVERTPSNLSGSSYNTTRQSVRGTSSGGHDESPRKHTETIAVIPPSPTSPSSSRTAPAPMSPEGPPPPPYDKPDVSRSPELVKVNSAATMSTVKQAKPKVKAVTKQRIELAADGATRITGFDAAPRPTSVATAPIAPHIRVAESVRSLESSRSSERDSRSYRPKPTDRPREQLFPETPAQAKRREERERRNLRAGKTSGGRLALDSVASSSRSRILPEIEIVEDDDPRIVFPSNGLSTRVQTTHDHVIRTSHDSRRADSLNTSGRSLTYGDGSNRAPSAIIEEAGGGYLPSRWANGDRHLRVTEEEKDRYRPREWGGKHGSLGGRPDEWRPDAKDHLKRNVKDLSTNARFSMFRAKKKILRKVE